MSGATRLPTLLASEADIFEYFVALLVETLYPHFIVSRLLYYALAFEALDRSFKKDQISIETNFDIPCFFASEHSDYFASVIVPFLVAVLASLNFADAFNLMLASFHQILQKQGHSLGGNHMPTGHLGLGFRIWRHSHDILGIGNFEALQMLKGYLYLLKLISIFDFIRSEGPRVVQYLVFLYNRHLINLKLIGQYR